jgi:hypothetical protein
MSATATLGPVVEFYDRNQAALDEELSPTASRSVPVGLTKLTEMTTVAQGILALARKRALAPNLEKTPRRYTLTEVAELVQIPRKTLEYAIQSKDLCAGRGSWRPRSSSLNRRYLRRPAKL